MAGIERKDNDNRKQNRYAQANKQTNKGNPPTGPPFAPIHLLSVVQINILCLWWHTLKGLVVGNSLSMRLHSPGHVPGLSPGVPPSGEDASNWAMKQLARTRNRKYRPDEKKPDQTVDARHSDRKS